MGVAAKRITARVCGLLAAVSISTTALAAPSGHVVIEGHAEFDQVGNTTIIETTTEQTIVEYESFDILSDEMVQIYQPTDDSRILNHIPHGDPTRLDGSLWSNGFVYVVNPAGVFLGEEAIIDVGGLVAAAGKLEYEDFLAGADVFSELRGDIHVEDGAQITAVQSVALVGRRVANFGTIVAEAGMVALVAGESAVLASLDGHIIVHVDGSGEALPAAEGFALTQGGSLESGGAGVVLAAGDTYSLAMNHTGVTRGADILLQAGGEGLVQVAGTLDASNLAAGGTGGSVRVLADRVAVLDARIDASGDVGGGEILIGGDVHGAGGVPTADRTFVGSEAELVADAISEGDGGKIVVWAEEKTGFYGSASARGGENGGDGGFIEISGRHFLETGGHRIDLSAPNGQSGTLLYDPDEIEIVGGAPPPDSDGSDAPDTSPITVVGDSGVAGRILDGDDGDGSEPFLIYESEIEGTDANIILEALRRVFVSGVFGDDDVVILSGNSLVVQTTGDPEIGPLEFAIDLGSDLTWKVSGGGIIYIATLAGDFTNLEEGPRANINVGNLEWERGYSDEFDGLLLPETLSVDVDALGVDPAGAAVTISTQVGSIVVGEIKTNGTDADADTDDMRFQFAGAAGNVFLTALSGDVTVGSIQAVGGSGVAPGVDFAPADGGNGGNITVFTNDGTVHIQDGIETSGGDGFSGFVKQPGEDVDIPVQGNGGFGGGIFVSAASFENSPGGLIVVTGDLISRGGSGEGFITAPAPSGSPETLPAFGRDGGSIVVTSENGILIQGTDSAGLPSRIEIDASGGDGTALGGSAGDSLGSLTAITIGIMEGDGEGINSGVQLFNVDIVANGGDAIPGGSGGFGGSGGSVQINAGNAAVVAEDVAIQANGGDGSDGPAGDFSIAGNGGSARTVRIIGATGVSFTDGSTIEALGGIGRNGFGGTGGSVDIETESGDILVGDIDASGGDAFEGFDDPQPVLGGPGRVISLTAGELEVEGEPPTGGNIVLSGEIKGIGGNGVDADGADTHAPGTVVVVSADGAIEAEPGADPMIQASAILLTAQSIGVGDPIDLAGTEASNDSASLTSDGSIEVNLLDDSGIEDVTVIHTSEFAETHLTENGDAMLEVVAALEDMDTGEVLDAQTIELMRTEDDDPRLHFVLDTLEEAAGSGGPDLEIDRGAGMLGSAGGSIRNDDGAILAGDDGTGSHLSITGDPDPEVITVLALAAEAIGDVAAPIEIDGDIDAALSLEARGDVYVDVIADSVAGGVEAFGAIELILADAGANALIGTRTDAGVLVESIEVRCVADGATCDPDVGPDPIDPVSVLTGSTAITGTNFALSLTGPAISGANPRLEIEDLVLGGNGVVSAPGDVRLIDDDGASIVFESGKTLVIESGADISWTQPGAGVAIEQVAGDGTDAAELVLLAVGGSVGSSDGGALVTKSFAGSTLELAGRTGSGAFRFENEGGGQLVITQIEVQDPRDVSGETTIETVTGIIARGEDADVSIRNEDRIIVLGEIVTGSPTAFVSHVDAIGDVTFHSDVEVENAQYVLTPTLGDDGLEEGAAVAVNTAGILSRGDVRFEGSVDTSDESTAEDDVSASDPEPDLFVHADLTVGATGNVTYVGDVGAKRALARLATSDAVLSDEDGDTVTFNVGDVIFLGSLDGPAAAVITGDASALQGDDPETSARFGGDIGTDEALGGLTVETDQIAFIAGSGSAERVVVDGDILLNTGLVAGVDAVPAVATITDALGDLRIETSGSFAVGDLDKLTAVGLLEIVAAGSVRVGDLSASSIRIDAPTILVMNDRDPGDVELPDGSSVTDRGADWVANEIFTTTAPRPEDPDSPLLFFLGSGGISVPGGLDDFEVRRINDSLGGIGSGNFIGAGGALLDLTGSGLPGLPGAFRGPPLVADPSRVAPRPVDSVLPVTPPRFGEDPAAAAARLRAAEVLAFLRCTGVYASGTRTSDSPGSPGCTPQDEAALAGVRRFRDSALATARAREITARYHGLVVSPGADLLHGAFATAGAGFGARREWRDGSLDGEEFYRFLESAPREHRAALASVHELAWLFAQIELLGLTGEDTRRLKRTLAQDFADAAGLSGLSAEAVTAAVDASPVGLVSH